MYNNTEKIIKGALGEIEILNTLDRLKEYHQFEYVHNLSIPKIAGDGYTQIDIVLLSTNGYYLVDVKNWAGDLYCSEKTCWDLASEGGLKLHVIDPLRQGIYHEICFGWITQLPSKSLVLHSNNLRVHNCPYYMYSESELPGIFSMGTQKFSKEQIQHDYQLILKLQDEYQYKAVAYYWSKRVSGKWG